MNEQNNNQNNHNNQSNQQNTQQNNQQPKNIQPKGDKKSSMFRMAGIAVVIVIIAALLINGKSKKVEAPVTDEAAIELGAEGCKVGDLFSETTGKPCPTETYVRDNENADYEGIVTAYQGKNITFSTGCVALPAKAMYPLNTRILLNNISSEPVNIAFNDKKVTLNPYHYATTALKTAGTFNATCDGKAVASVTVK